MSTATMLTTATTKPRRKRSPLHRRPYPRNGWRWAGDDGTMAVRETQRGVGTIVFPDPDEGWSPLCVRLVELACNFVIGDLRWSIREWAGPVPGLQRDDLLCAADQILNDDHRDKIPFADILAALAEAHRFVGFKN